MTYQRESKKGGVVMRITNAEVLRKVDQAREDLRELLGCRRHPGIQVTIDLLLEAWRTMSSEDQRRLVADWKTPVHGYPNSIHENLGQFASKKELERARRRMARAKEGTK